MITPLGLRAAAAVQTRLTHHEAVVLFLIGGVSWQSIHLLGEKLEAHKQMKPASARASAYNALKRLAEAGLVEYGRAKARLTALGLSTLPDAELYVRCAG